MKKFERLERYRHVSAKDIDIFVLSVQELSSSFHLVIRYWNRFYKRFQGEVEVVTILKKHLHKWKKVPKDDRANNR